MSRGALACTAASPVHVRCIFAPAAPIAAARLPSSLLFIAVRAAGTTPPALSSATPRRAGRARGRRRRGGGSPACARARRTRGRPRGSRPCRRLAYWRSRCSTTRGRSCSRACCSAARTRTRCGRGGLCLAVRASAASCAGAERILVLAVRTWGKSSCRDAALAPARAGPRSAGIVRQLTLHSLLKRCRTRAHPTVSQGTGTCNHISSAQRGARRCARCGRR